jgi:gliding motility-associated-like protein
MDDFFYHCIIMLNISLTRKIRPITGIITKYGKALCFLLLLAASSLINAQISSPDKDAGFIANYPSNKGSDSVFMFNQPVFNGTRTITLQAVSTDNTSGWSFIWSKYNTTSRSYVIIPKADAGISSTIDTISVSSGYQVIITKGAASDTFRVWLLFNDFEVKLIDKDASGKLLSGYRSCESVSLRTDTNHIWLGYPEPGTNNNVTVINKDHFVWKSDNELSADPTGTNTGRIKNPPYQDTWYRVTVTDDFNLSRSDSVFCPAISSKASMSADPVPLSDSAEYPDKPYKYYYDDESSAPGKYRFDFSGSKNTVWYKIEFGDSLMLELSSDSAEIVHEYLLPGKYTAVLFTRSPEPYSCPDSFVIENSIELPTAEFEIPNVFTPNGDLRNDIIKLYEENNVFRSKDVSVFSIEITIFDRIGRKVHEYSGNIRDWKGWDGNVMGSNREAPDGVYFYCLTRHFYGTSEGSEKLIPREEKDKGFIHLYRE